MNECKFIKTCLVRHRELEGGGLYGMNHREFVSTADKNVRRIAAQGTDQGRKGAADATHSTTVPNLTLAPLVVGEELEARVAAMVARVRELQCQRMISRGYRAPAIGHAGKVTG